MAHDAFAAGGIGARNLFPVHLRQNFRDVPFIVARLQSDEPRDGLVEINHAPVFVHDQHAVLDRVEQRFEKAAFACKPLDDRLQTLRVQPSDAAKHFVEKTGFGCSH